MKNASTRLDLENCQELIACDTPLMLAAAIGRLARSLGFEHWMYALDLPVMGERRDEYMLGGYPDAWVAHYLASGYLRVDPVVAHCQSHTTPFLWPSPQPRPRGGASHTTDVWQMFQEAGELGLRGGITVPLHGLGCRWGLVSFSTEKPLDSSAQRELAPAVHLLAHYVHEAGHRHAHPTEAVRVPHLTARELECLHWAADGKTSWEIGRLLNVAERTVVFHLRNAASKFGVGGRQAAVARAMAAGVIHP